MYKDRPPGAGQPEASSCRPGLQVTEVDASRSISRADTRRPSSRDTIAVFGESTCGEICARKAPIASVELLCAALQ
jgi:hypothetical protein